ncbi:MAG: sulfatase [Planctomycetota bacterium]
MRSNKVKTILRSHHNVAWLLSLCLPVFISISLGNQQATAEQPNFVFILVDDLGKMDLGCEGSSFYETPHIDQLAGMSLRFENGYSACQVCSPSRAAIQTGKTPARVHITDYISPAGRNQPEQWSRNTKLLPASFQKELALEETTIAEALKAEGYHTYFAGKWHLGGKGYWPTDQGYDINVGGHEAGTPPGGYFAPYNNPVLDGEPGEHLPIRLGQETANYIRSRAGQQQPFFAMLCYYSVHGPIQTTETLWAKYQSKADRLGLNVDRQRFVWDRTQEVRQTQDSPLYAGMMEALDDSVGHVMDALRESGQLDNTVVIFTSDNGGVSSGDGYATAALPMRGGKGRQWEGGIRQPFYISVPGKTSGRTTETLANGVDFFPTILDLAGVDGIPSGIDGRSLKAELDGKQLPSQPLFWHYPHYGNQGGEPSGIVRDGQWKLIRYYEDQRSELYDLGEDIGEQNDLAAEHPEQVKELNGLLSDWLNEVGAKYPSVNSKYDAEKYAQSVADWQSNRMTKREREHRSYLQSDFQPRNGWWQDNKRKPPQNAVRQRSSHA